MQRSVLVTGSTGLLGREFVKSFRAAGWTVHCLSFSRGGEDYVRCDLRDFQNVYKIIDSISPSLVVHSAAERRPDVCEKDSSSSEALNIDSVWHLGRAAAKVGAAFIYISTDYLFDGQSPPYFPDSPVNPLNAYGSQKARGEWAARASHPGVFCLRVPVLFGPTDDLRESAVTTFAEAAREASKAQTIDDWQIRVPTYTPDIAQTVERVASALLGAPPQGSMGDALHPSRLAGIWQYSSKDTTTRYKLTQLFGELLGVSVSHISKLEGMPPGAPRPRDCMLNTEKLDATGLSAPCTPLLQALKTVLKC